MKQNIVIRKHADRSEGMRIERYDQFTGEKKLINPATPGEEHEPWPLLGVEFVGGVPSECRIAQSVITRGMAEGWITAENERAVVRPAGPVDSKLSLWHTFLHCDSITFETVDGPHTFLVTRQPDKYAAEGDDETPVTDEMYAAGETQVDFYFELQIQE